MSFVTGAGCATHLKARAHLGITAPDTHVPSGNDLEQRYLPGSEEYIVRSEYGAPVVG